MTKYLTPRSDSVSVKIIEPSDFEKFFTSDLVRDHKISGFTLSGGTGLTVNVTLGEARLKGLHLESTAQETVSGLTASDVNYIYVKLARDSNSEAESWDFDKNVSGTTPTDAFFIGTATTNGSTVTSVDQTDVITTINDNDSHNDVYYGDGSDGDDVVISSSTTFGTIKQYNKSLTINSGVTITPTATSNATIIILVNGTLTLNGTINMNGKGGIGGPLTTGGTSGSGGGDGSAGQGRNGMHGVKGLNCGGSGGTGGAGGKGRVASSGRGDQMQGGMAVPGINCELNIIKTKPNILSKSLPQFYGCGGSAGSSGGGGSAGSTAGAYGGACGVGGAGGNGGGGVLIICKTFNNTGSITANATDGSDATGGSGGGNDGGHQGGGGGGAGGGGGGEGGSIIIAYQTLTALGTVTSTAGAAGGSSGIGGNGSGGSVGSVGGAGSAGVITQVSIT